MIPLPHAHGWEKEMDRHSSDGDGWTACVICGRKVKDAARVPLICEGNGGDWIVNVEERAANPGADVGWRPIGWNCWRNFPQVQPYAVCPGDPDYPELNAWRAASASKPR